MTARNQIGMTAALISASLSTGLWTADWRSDATLFIDHYSNDRNTEEQLDLSLGKRLEGPWTPVAMLSYQHRYDAIDTQGQAWLYSPAVGPAYGWAMVGATYDPDFLANYLAEIGGDVELPSSTGFTGRVRWQDYGDERIYMLWAVGRQQIGPVNVEGGYVWALSDTQPTVGSWQLGLRSPPMGSVSLRAYASIGEENQPPQPISQVVIVGLQMWWALSEASTLRLECNYEDRENLYTRQGVACGGTWRF